MAFKSVKNYNEERFGGLFLLRNDGDEADVIFLYNNVDDVLVAETHYIKSSEYSGYVHCCGKGCPACDPSLKIRVQTKLFIPLYNINDGGIQFWDRTMRFEPQLQNDVFKHYPDPANYVFRIKRRGAAGDINTTYEITAVGKNTVKSYAQILSENNATFPEYYNKVCKEVTSAELQSMLNSPTDSNPSASNLPSYQVQPRQSSQFNQPTYAEAQETPNAVPMPEMETSGVPFDASASEELDDDVKF